MADFPENEIEILDDYVSDDFIAGMTGGFSRDFLAGTRSLENIIPEVKRDQLERISLARKNLLRFFTHPIFTKSRDGLRAVMDETAKGHFQDAQTQLDVLGKLASVTIALDFVDALNFSPVNFTEVQIHEIENPIPWQAADPDREEDTAHDTRLCRPKAK